MARKQRTPFTLKSGNSIPFKAMGSSPVKNKSKLSGIENINEFLVSSEKAKDKSNEAEVKPNKKVRAVGLNGKPILGFGFSLGGANKYIDQALKKKADQAKWIESIKPYFEGRNKDEVKNA
jgi:hypothetical protein